MQKSFKCKSFPRCRHSQWNYRLGWELKAKGHYKDQKDLKFACDKRCFLYDNWVCLLTVHSERLQLKPESAVQRAPCTQFRSISQQWRCRFLRRPRPLKLCMPCKFFFIRFSRPSPATPPLSSLHTLEGSTHLLIHHRRRSHHQPPTNTNTNNNNNSNNNIWRNASRKHKIHKYAKPDYIKYIIMKRQTT